MYYLQNYLAHSSHLQNILKLVDLPLFLFSDKNLIDSKEKIENIYKCSEYVQNELSKVNIYWLKGIIIKGRFKSLFKINNFHVVSEDIEAISGIILFNKKSILFEDLLKSIKNDIINNGALYIYIDGEI